MGISIAKPGILTTVQDLGRIGLAASGINRSGVMDRVAVRLLNALLGNEERSAVLEMHFPAAEIVFEAKTVCAVGGADFSPVLNGRSISNWKVFVANKGDVLKFKGRKLGSWCYLAVSGGFKVPQWHGSSSTNLVAHCGGHEGRALIKGDKIPIHTNRKSVGTIGKSLAHDILPCYSTNPIIRLIESGETRQLSKETLKQMTATNFTVSVEADRMGYRLSGAPIATKKSFELLTSAATFGTVQLLPDGQLVILMADHQTSGGYPRVGAVIEVDLPQLAQASPGNQLTFEFVTVEEAEFAFEKFERDLRILKTAIGGLSS